MLFDVGGAGANPTHNIPARTRAVGYLPTSQVQRINPHRKAARVLMTRAKRKLSTGRKAAKEKNVDAGSRR